MTVLSVNLNKVALLRNQRDLRYPSLIHMAGMAIAAGAAGITVHPRPDERHIRRSDVFELADMLKRDYSATSSDTIEFNVEGYPSDNFMDIIQAVRPDQVTLVPDAPDQSTSDHGWGIPANMELLRTVTRRLHDFGCRVSLFVDDDPAMAEPARATGTDRVELYTGPYNEAFMAGAGPAAEALKKFSATAQAMADVGLDLNAGHDLNLDNLPDFMAAIPYIAEVSIGHAIWADALHMGIDKTVRAYVASIGSIKARASA